MKKHLRALATVGVVIMLAAAIVPVGLAAGFPHHAGVAARSPYAQMQRDISKSYQISVRQQSPTISASQQSNLYARFQRVTAQACYDATIIQAPLPAGGALFAENYC